MNCGCAYAADFKPEGFHAKILSRSGDIKDVVHGS